MMNKLIKNSKGFTLVEVIVSMAILALIATAFVPLFGFSFTSIFSYGERDKAMSVASDIMEVLYAEQELDLNPGISSDDYIEGLIDDYSEGEDYYLKEVEKKDDNNPFEVSQNGETIEITGYKITIEVPYKNGERHVTLTSFVRGKLVEED